MAAKSALPSHLKSSGLAGNANGEAAEFARKHHGKTQSHMVSVFFIPFSVWGEARRLRNGIRLKI